MAVIHPPASRTGPDWGRGRSGVVSDLVPGWPAHADPCTDPTPDGRPRFTSPPWGGLVIGPRNGGVQYVTLRERLHFAPQGFRGMASPTDGEPNTAA